MKQDAIQPFHADDLKRIKELSYLRSSPEAYFLLGIRGWNFDLASFRLTPVLLNGDEGPAMDLRSMHDGFGAWNGD